MGGVFGGNIKPTPFLCLTLKMLQIQPEKDIVVEFIKNQEFKYVRALGAFYLRLTGTSIDCYKYLEPLYNDNRKLRRQNREGQYEIVHMDEFIDELLRNDRVCDIILPRVQKRHILEENNDLEPKTSALDDDLDDDGSDDNSIEEAIKQELYSPAPNKHKKPDREHPDRKGKLPERTERDRDRGRERSKSRSRERDYRRHEKDHVDRYDRERDRDRGRRDRDKDKYHGRGERDDRDRRGRRDEGDSKKRDRRDKDYDRHDRKNDYDRRRH